MEEMAPKWGSLRLTEEEEKEILCEESTIVNPQIGDSRFKVRECMKYTVEQLLELRKAVAEVPDASLQIKRQTEIAIFGEEQSWGRRESNGGHAPALVKAEVPWLARRGVLSDEDRVLKTVKGILNKLTPEKFDILKGQLIDSGITSADILKGVVYLIFDKAVIEPTFCPMYARLCCDLNEKLPPFPSDEPGGKEITFKRLLLNKCQEAFEGAENLSVEMRQMTAPERMLKIRTLGNIRLTGELFKQMMVVPEKIVRQIVQELFGQDTKTCPAEENVEAICQFFNTIGKQLDRRPTLLCINDIYFSRLKELTTDSQLAPRMRFLVRDVLDRRANKWVPRREEAKAKNHSQKSIRRRKKNRGLRSGATANIGNNLSVTSVSTDPVGVGEFVSRA